MAIDTHVLINDIDNDITNVGNWDIGSVPTTGDTVIISNGAWVLTGATLDLSATVDDLIIITEDQFSGQIGTPGTPLKIGETGGATLHYNSPACQSFHIEFSGTLTEAYVLGTHPDAASFTIEGGTVAVLWVGGGRGGVGRAAATFTSVIVDGPTADFTLESGNTCPEVWAHRGILRTLTDTEKVHIGNGVCYLRGASLTYDELNLYAPGARAYLECPGSIITQITARAGTVDGTKGNKAITVTDATAYDQAALLYGGHIIETNVPVMYGNPIYRGRSAAIWKSPMGAGGG